MRWLPLLRTLLTSVETGWKVIELLRCRHEEPAEGGQVLLVGVEPFVPRRRGNITGIRSWISAIFSLGEPVTMVVERNTTTSPVASLPRHSAQSPANAKGSPSGRVM